MLKEEGFSEEETWIHLTEDERRVLIQVYKFQAKRNFRYGLNKHYIKGVGNVDKVIDSLKKKGLVFTITPYKNKEKYVYVFLTRKGRETVCKNLD